MVYGFLNTYRASVLWSFIFTIFIVPIFISGQALYSFCFCKSPLYISAFFSRTLTPVICSREGALVLLRFGALLKGVLETGRELQ